MKPLLDAFAVCVATTDPARADDCFRSWERHAAYRWPIYVLWNSPKAREIVVLPFASHEVCLLKHVTPLGTVPAYASLTAAAKVGGAQILCCLHDDLLIEDPDWDLKVMEVFATHPTAGLVGFGGGRTLGAADIYQTPYDPMQLARGDFVSNLRDAEHHGRRVQTPVQLACLDGLSQIGRTEFLVDAFRYIQAQGVIHHAYDSWLGALAARAGWEVWLAPIACHHFGGRTAVADPDYAAWARTQHPEGDQGFWAVSHRKMYEDCRDILPIGGV